MILRLGIVWVLLLAAATQVLAGRFTRKRDSASFYQPPQGYENSAPGTILRARQIVPASFGAFPIGVTGYQLLYRTNGNDKNSPSTTVTTVLVPDNYDKDKLVVAGVYEDSYSSECAPSQTIQWNGRVFKNLPISYQTLFFTTLLHEGWVVTVPDHEGPQKAFTSGYVEGHAILDAIRATLSFDQIGMQKHAKVVGYGYSGGALATGWAASLHNHYAPELNVVGWSIGGTVARVRDWLQYIDGTTGAGFSVASIGGLSASIPELHWIQQNLTPRGRLTLDISSRMCMYENLWTQTGKHFISDTYFKGGSSFFQNEGVNAALSRLNLGSNPNLAPRAPVFMFHSKNDLVVPYSFAYGTYQAWCSQGANVHLRTNTGLEMDHTNTELLNLPNVLFFMRDRFAGRIWGSSCKADSVLDPYLNPLVLGQGVAEYVQQVIDLLGTRIGPNDWILKQKLEKGQEP
ncbi:Uncharacterized protein MSYG_2468 [Malassezia sympodialis ATCC 42132]|uniref:triacylglycerol lipase n=2 Tax=Malassezia sympodialis TaxID=76777 RepID=A0A1M8A6N1_MALS4|nr:Uncharacterized protein MSYG_2468 [Malassezia sympodialis ATCC 42132]